jgi:intracellular multiplication protein IcmD
MRTSRILLLLIALTVSYVAAAACTATIGEPETIGQVLCNIKLNTFQGIFKLIFAFAYVSGVGLLVAAVFKLKQVKDNPTQIPISTPMVLFLCAGLSMYLPSLIVPAGESIFAGSTNVPAPSDALQDPAQIGTPSITNLLDG